uniref:Ig-like domain-containing protein n=1 Tax=Chelydra serpentina TaxID=8475 RepID=A0A8C3S424_CHESE
MSFESYHTPAGTPERYSTPSEEPSFNRKSPSDLVRDGTPPECYKTPNSEYPEPRTLHSPFQEKRTSYEEQHEDVKIDFEVTEMPPRFTTPLFDLEILENSEAVFECTVTGSPTPQVQWFKDHTCIIADGGSYIVTDEKGSHSLKIQNVGHSDSGTYRCKAANSVGEAICKSCLVVNMRELSGAGGLCRHSAQG